MTASSSSSRKITLVSSDKEFFEVDEIVAQQSRTVRHMIEDVVDENTFTLPNVDGKTLAKVVEYCKKHVESPTPTDEDLKHLNAFDARFMKVDQSEIIELVLAANYLDIKGLLDLSCQTIADLIKDMAVEDVRKMFNIENDFTPAEEAATRNEHEWVFK